MLIQSIANPPLSYSLRARVHRTVQAALSDFERRIDSCHVRVARTRSSRGLRHFVKIRVNLVDSRRLVVEHSADSFEEALGLAAERLAEEVSALVERRPRRAVLASGPIAREL